MNEPGISWLSVLEWVSVAFNVAFTVMIAYEKRSGWLCGFVGSALAVVLYAQKDLWGLTSLQVFFAMAGLYGFWRWGAENERPIVVKGFGSHASFVLVMGAGVLLGGIFLRDQLGGNQPFVDAFITFFSVGATMLMAWKWLGHWVYWIVIDSVWMALNIQVGFYPFAALSAIYLVLSVFGWIRWKREFNSSQLVGVPPND